MFKAIRVGLVDCISVQSMMGNGLELIDASTKRYFINVFLTDEQFMTQIDHLNK